MTIIGIILILAGLLWGLVWWYCASCWGNGQAWRHMLPAVWAVPVIVAGLCLIWADR